MLVTAEPQRRLLIGNGLSVENKWHTTSEWSFASETEMVNHQPLLDFATDENLFLKFSKNVYHNSAGSCRPQPKVQHPKIFLLL